MNLDFSLLANINYIYFVLFFLAINLGVWLAYQIFSRSYPFISKLFILLLFFTIFISLRLPLFFLTIPGEHDLIFLSNAFLVGGLVYLFFKLLDVFVFDFILKEKKHIYLPPLLHNIILGLVYLIIVFTFLRSAFNINLTPILATSAVFSMMIGLAMQDVLINLFGGIILSIEQPFKIGDWVEINNHQGKVIQINWRTTKLQTKANDCIIIPNGAISKADLINYYNPTKLHMEKIKIGANYHIPPSKVKKVLLAAVNEIAGVRKEPAAEVFLLSYEDFAIVYELRVWIEDFAEVFHYRNEIYSLIWYHFRRHHIEVPFPIRQVNLHNITKTTEEELHSIAAVKILPILRKIPILKPLNEAEFELLASNVSSYTYAEKEIIFRENEAGDTFYIIQTGEVEVSKETENHALHAIATLKENDYFGEMSLFTGARRTATVRAVVDTDLIAISKDVFRQILIANPAIAEELSQVLHERQKETSFKVSLLEIDLAKTSVKVESSSNLLKNIRHFFGL